MIEAIRRILPAHDRAQARRRACPAILAACALLVGTAPAAAQNATAPAPAPLSVASARASLIGRWQGKLEYRDYQADKWFGLPMKVEIRDGGDGVTQISAADFDDGPKVGNVRITTVSLLGKDGATEYAVSMRKNDVPDLNTHALTLTAARDATHWTMVASEAGKDDDRPATLRETTVRDGDSLVTLKEVDFTDDAKAEWLVRNRTTLMRVGG